MCPTFSTSKICIVVVEMRPMTHNYALTSNTKGVRNVMLFLDISIFVCHLSTQCAKDILRLD